MKQLLPNPILRRLVITTGTLMLILVGGTVGYRLLTGPGNSLFDCFYMTVITITTIGYGEMIDLTGNVPARLFTMLIALSGIGMLTYILSSMTAFVVEGALKETFRRRRMQKKIDQLSGHYLICGASDEAENIARELTDTRRSFILIDPHVPDARFLRDLHLEDPLVIAGDPSEDHVLEQAGIKRAAGLFAATGDDNTNLVISLTARQLNPRLRIVACCRHAANAAKLKVAGADEVVSPALIGGMRMASVMVRPAVVSFLDVMLRDREQNLRVEEVTIGSSFAGRPIRDLNFSLFKHTLILALKQKENWIYNPPRTHLLQEGEVLVFMTIPEEKAALEKLFN